MTAENSNLGPSEDFSEWVGDTETSQDVTRRQETSVNRRWCPTHRKWEVNPPGKLLCGPAWAELYKMEADQEMGQTGTIQVLSQIVEKIEDLVYVIERRRNVIAEPPTKPQMPPPPPIPPTPPRRAVNGRGGIELR